MGGGFLVSDTETINPVTGNVMLRIPLASLPPGRGGSAFTLDLLYNSQIWDVEPELYQYSETESELRHRPQLSSQGGWRYGFEYGLEYEGRLRLGGGDCIRDYTAEFNHCSVPRSSDTGRGGSGGFLLSRRGYRCTGGEWSR